MWCPDPGAPGGGTVVCTSVADGALLRVDLGTGRVDVVATVGGGANAAYPASDGGFLVTQNGGIDFTRAGIYARRSPAVPARDAGPPARRRGRRRHATCSTATRSTAASWRPTTSSPTPTARSTSRIRPEHPPPPEPTGRVHALDPDGTVRTVATGFHYCNGIAPRARRHGRRGRRAGAAPGPRDGTTEWIVEQLPHGTGDGFCVDVDGRFYVALDRRPRDRGHRARRPRGRLPRRSGVSASRPTAASAAPTAGRSSPRTASPASWSPGRASRRRACRCTRGPRAEPAALPSGPIHPENGQGFPCAQPSSSRTTSRSSSRT